MLLCLYRHIPFRAIHSKDPKEVLTSFATIRLSAAGAAIGHYDATGCVPRLRRGWESALRSSFVTTATASNRVCFASFATWKAEKLVLNVLKSL